MPVEPAGAHQRRIEHIGAVRCRHDHDRFGRGEAVHFAQDLVEGLFPFVVAAPQPCSALAADSVNLVDEENARGFGTRFVKELAHTRCTDADEHLHEFGTVDRKKTHPGFAGHGAGQECFSRAGRAEKKGAFRDAGAHFVVPLGVFKVVDDLFEFLLDVVEPGNVGECHTVFLFGIVGTHRAFHESAEPAPHHLLVGPPHHPPENQEQEAAEQYRCDHIKAGIVDGGIRCECPDFLADLIVEVGIGERRCGDFAPEFTVDDFSGIRTLSYVDDSVKKPLGGIGRIECGIGLPLCGVHLAECPDFWLFFGGRFLKDRFGEEFSRIRFKFGPFDEGSVENISLQGDRVNISLFQLLIETVPGDKRGTGIFS